MAQISALVREGRQLASPTARQRRNSSSKWCGKSKYDE